MTDQELRRSMQIILAKLALNITLTDKEKGIRLADRAKKAVKTDRQERRDA